MAFPKRKNLHQQTRQKLVIVGSKNPVKIQSAEDAFQAVFEGQFIVQGLEVDAQVSAQPFGDVDTYTGAYNRAYASKNAFPEADFWVGIEGGVDEVGEQMVAFAWVVVLNGSQIIGKAKTSTFFLPDAISEHLRKGKELGEASDLIFNKENSKQAGGAVGLLTKGLLPRKEYYYQAVILSLLPYMNEELY
ncbi:MAG TPA: inosine/xanthosine triphosphatase [Lunatimonas sp.]|nr:inosine/xanthosine triphosphatase [Lunatimonas sp.]